MSKAQVGMETFVVMLVVSLLFLYSFMTYVNRNKEIKLSDKMLSAQRECYIISDLINRVRYGGRGFAERISFKNKVKIYGNDGGIEVYFDSDGTTNNYYCTFSTSNVTNTSDSTFEVYGNYKVVNEGVNIVFYKI